MSIPPELLNYLKKKYGGKEPSPKELRELIGRLKNESSFNLDQLIKSIKNYFKQNISFSKNALFHGKYVAMQAVTPYIEAGKRYVGLGDMWEYEYWNAQDTADYYASMMQDQLNQAYEPFVELERDSRGQIHVNINQAENNTNSILDSLENYLQNDYEQVKNQVQNTINQIENQVKNGSYDASKNLQEIVKSLENFLKQHEEWVKQLTQELEQYENKTVEQALESVEGVSEYVRNMIQNELQAHETWLTHVRRLLEGDLSNIAEWLESYGKWFTNVLLATLTKVWGRVMDYLSRLDTYIAKGFVTGVKELDKMIMGNLKETYKEMAKAMYEAQKELAEEMIRVMR